jgi:H(+)-transporting ATP synthase, vacuolar type, subunit D
MAQINPTKSVLLATKKSMSLAKTGYDLLDRKRNILIREIMTMLDDIKDIQNQIGDTYAAAYRALQNANLTLGTCDEIAGTVPIEDGIELDWHSVMGVELPTVTLNSGSARNTYGYYGTNFYLDEAYVKFAEVKRLTLKLAEIEDSVCRLAAAIKKTQKRANALKNIVIPRFNDTIHYISGELEEKEREEFSRMKVIKSNRA